MEKASHWAYDQISQLNNKTTTSTVKPKQNGEQVAVANPIGALSAELSHNYNLNIFVHHRSL
jgi:hypothetical protein